MHRNGYVSHLFPLCLALLMFGLPTLGYAESLPVPPRPVLAEGFILKATVWADPHVTEQMAACDLAKDRATDVLGAQLQAIHAHERFGTDSFPSHYFCSWDQARKMFRLTMTVELPGPPSLGSTTADRLY